MITEHKTISKPTNIFMRGDWSTTGSAARQPVVFGLRRVQLDRRQVLVDWRQVKKFDAMGWAAKRNCAFNWSEREMLPSIEEPSVRKSVEILDQKRLWYLRWTRGDREQQYIFCERNWSSWDLRMIAKVFALTFQPCSFFAPVPFMPRSNSSQESIRSLSASNSRITCSRMRSISSCLSTESASGASSWIFSAYKEVEHRMISRAQDSLSRTSLSMMASSSASSR